MFKTRLRRSLRVTMLGMVVNTFLAAAKLLAGVLGNSYALIADGVESMADILSSLVVWRGLVVAAEPADEDHPYGHGKAEPIAAAVVSGMLLLAALWISVQAIHSLSQPHPPPAAYTLIVLVVVMAIKETLFRVVLRQSEDVQSSAVRTDAWHHRSDAISSFAAFMGISISLIGGRDYAKADEIAALAAAGLIAFNGWRLLHPALGELMDRAPSPEFAAKVKQLAESVPGVEQVEKCLMRKMGYLHYVDMHVQVDPAMTVERSHDIAHRVKDRLRQAYPQIGDVLVHIEPALEQFRKPK